MARKQTKKSTKKAAKKATKKTSKRGKGSSKKPPAKPSDVVKPPDLSTLSRHALEGKLNALRDAWERIEAVEKEKADGTKTRKDKIDNLTAAIESVVREDQHDKPARELDNCRKWILERDKAENALDRFKKAKSGEIAELRSRFRELLFGEQLTLALPAEGATSEGKGDGGTNGKVTVSDLAAKKAPVTFKRGRKTLRGTVEGSFKDKPELAFVRLDKPIKVKGKENTHLSVPLEQLTLVEAT